MGGNRVWADYPSCPENRHQCKAFALYKRDSTDNRPFLIIRDEQLAFTFAQNNDCELRRCVVGMIDERLWEDCGFDSWEKLSKAQIAAEEKEETREELLSSIEYLRNELNSTQEEVDFVRDRLTKCERELDDAKADAISPETFRKEELKVELLRKALSKVLRNKYDMDDDEERLDLLDAIEEGRKFL